jgi:hypothetical protein
VDRWIWIFLLFLFLFLAFGCTSVPRYDITLNGYLDPDPTKRIAPASALHILQDPNRENPLLEKEVAHQLEAELEKQGYAITSLEEADYCIRFHYGMGADRQVRYEYRDMPGFGPYPYYGYRYDPWCYPFTGARVVTWVGTEYSMILVLQAFDAKAYRKDASISMYWVGEALCIHSSPDLRTALPYMILALMNHFGKDTVQGIQVSIPGV